MKAPTSATLSAPRRAGSLNNAPITSAFAAMNVRGSRPSAGPGDVCSTSPIQTAGFSSGCIAAKKSQKRKGAQSSSPETPLFAISAHCDANLANAGACTSTAASEPVVAAMSGQRGAASASSGSSDAASTGAACRRKCVTVGVPGPSSAAGLVETSRAAARAAIGDRRGAIDGSAFGE